MKKLVFAGLLLACAPALAGSYNDFSLGISAHNDGEDTLAIADFTRALARGDLAQGLVPTAYLDRAISYLRTDRCALARTDLDTALHLRPDFLEVVSAQAAAEACLGQNDAALADLKILAVAKPDAQTYGRIGRLRWIMGDFASAGDNFRLALKLDPKKPYYLLWLGITQMRAGNFDASVFSDYLSGMSVDAWPLPVLELFLGKETLANVLADAASADAADIPGRECQANFYGGEWNLVHGDASASSAMFQAAVNVCPKTFAELAPAKLELKRLQQTPG